VRNAIGAAKLATRLPRLEDVDLAGVACWPRLSVIVPACNEAEEIGSAVATLLGQDYPDMEIILVDDRSSDATGEIMDRVAADDPRVKVIHVTALPEGWLGKVHAMQQGLAASTGEFLLFTDADVHYAPDALRRAVGYCVLNEADHVPAIPNLWSQSLLQDALVRSSARHVVLNARPWAVSDPKSKAFLGVGAFNLVRRSAFEKTEGFAWLRLEVADDLGLGLMMKRSGARCQPVSAFEHVGLYWYRTFGAVVRGGAKAYAVSRFRLGRQLLLGLVVLVLETAPVALLVPLIWAQTRWVGIAGIVVTVAFFTTIVTLSRWSRGRLVGALFEPVVAPLLVGLFVHAGIAGWWRGGLVWRGTLYPSELLRAGARVPFP